MHSLTTLLDNCKWRYKGLWPANKENRDKDQEFLPDNKRYQVVKLPHGPLLDEKLLDKVQTKLKETYDTKKRMGRDNYVYLLSGLLEYEDGTKFHGAHGKGGKYRYYYNDANKIRIRCDAIDGAVREKIQSFYFSDKSFIKKIKKAYQYLEASFPILQKQIVDIEKELDKISAEEKNLDKTFKSEKLESPAYSDWIKKKVTEVSEKRVTIEKKLSFLMEYKINILNKQGFNTLQEGLKKYLDSGFGSLGKTTQRHIIQKIIPSVTIRNKGKTVEANLLNPLDFVVTSNMNNRLDLFKKSEKTEEKVLVGLEWRERSVWVSSIF